MAEQKRTLSSWQHLANLSGPTSEPCPQCMAVPCQQGCINILQRQSSQTKHSSIASRLGEDGKRDSLSSTNNIPGTPTQLDPATPAKRQKCDGEFPSSTSANTSGTPPTPPDDKNTDKEEYPSHQHESSKFSSHFRIASDVASQIAEQLPWFVFVDDPMAEYMKDMEAIGHANSPAPPLPPNTFACK